MMKIGSTSEYKGVEGALCMDMSYEIAYVIDTEKNEIIRSLPNGAVSFLLA